MRFNLFGERLEAAVERAQEATHKRLMLEMVTALECPDAGAIVSTPAFGTNRTAIPAREAVIELVQYPGNAWIEDDMFRLAALAMKSSDTALRLTAQAWAAKVAEAHATLHADDAADAEVVHEVMA